MAGMTPQEAMAALLTEFNLLDCLEQWDDVVREQVRDEGCDGLTEAHPKVQRYRDACAALRSVMRPIAASQRDGEAR